MHVCLHPTPRLAGLSGLVRIGSISTTVAVEPIFRVASVLFASTTDGEAVTFFLGGMTGVESTKEEACGCDEDDKIPNRTKPKLRAKQSTFGMDQRVVPAAVFLSG